jgi:nucleoside phosphorylase
MSLSDGRQLPVDVAIVTALDEELVPVRALKGDNAWTSQDFKNRPRPYYQTTFTTGTTTLTVAAATAGATGGDAINNLLTNVLSLRPRLTILVGICAGPRKKVQLGDVLIAEWAFHKAEGKDTVGGFMPSGATYASSNPYPLTWARGFRENRDWIGTITSCHPDYLAALLLCKLRNGGLAGLRPADRKWLLGDKKEVAVFEEWLRQRKYIDHHGSPTNDGLGWLEPRCIRRLNRYQPSVELVASAPGVEIAPAVQSPSVEDRAGFFEEQTRRARKLRLLDMECASFYYTTSQHQAAALVAKSVVDYADGQKDDRYHSYSAEVSAQWAYAYIMANAQRILDLPRPLYGIGAASSALDPPAHPSPHSGRPSEVLTSTSKRWLKRVVVVVLAVLVMAVLAADQVTKNTDEPISNQPTATIGSATKNTNEPISGQPTAMIGQIITNTDEPISPTTIVKVINNTGDQMNVSFIGQNPDISIPANQERDIPVEPGQYEITMSTKCGGSKIGFTISLGEIERLDPNCGSR